MPATTKDELEKLVHQQLLALGIDTDRPGLLKTPQRVAKSLRFMTSGYDVDLKTLVNGALFPTKNSAEIVLVRDISFASTCEHHLLPFFGKVHVGYIPRQSIIGLSKIPRIVDAFSRRLQVQENLTGEIGVALWGVLHPHGLGVVVEAEHMCMRLRGVQQAGSTTQTIYTRGTLAPSDRPSPRRDEFLAMCRGR